MDFLAGMEFDLYVPSFPELQNYFYLSSSAVEWSLSINFIGYCISLFIVSELADRYGRKPIIIMGLIIFILGSVLCLTANHYYIFIIGRFLQGLGIAAPSILSFLIIADLYPVKKQQFLLAMLNGSLNIATACAPVMGSYITQYFHWQGNMAALLLLSTAVLLMTLVFIPNTKSVDMNNNSIIQNYSKIFKSNTILLIMIYFVFLYTPYWIFVGMSPLLFMKNLGVSLNHFGYYQGVMALVFALGSIAFGFAIYNFNHKKLLSISNQILLISLLFIIVLVISNSISPFFITLAFVIFVIGQIIPSNILYPLYINLMPNAKARLTAIAQGSRLIISSLGLQIASWFYDGTFLSIGITAGIFILIAFVMKYFVLRQWGVINKT